MVVGGADGRASGQRTLLSLSGSFSQLKLQLRQLVQLTCQAKRTVERASERGAGSWINVPEVKLEELT